MTEDDLKLQIGWGLIVILLLFFFLCVLLVLAGKAEWKSIGVREVTCYKLNEAECDKTPWEGAYGLLGDKNAKSITKSLANKKLETSSHAISGFYCAANFLKKGDRLKIPSLTGELVWVVMDRTSKRCGQRVDLCFPPEAKTLGLRKSEVYLWKK